VSYRTRRLSHSMDNPSRPSSLPVPGAWPRGPQYPAFPRILRSSGRGWAIPQNPENARKKLAAAYQIRLCCGKQWPDWRSRRIVGRDWMVNQPVKLRFSTTGSQWRAGANSEHDNLHPLRLLTTHSSGRVAALTLTVSFACTSLSDRILSSCKHGTDHNGWFIPHR
jgi:hypothetical protein